MKLFAAFNIAVVLAAIFLLSYRVQWGSAAPPPRAAVRSHRAPLNLFRLTHPNHAKPYLRRARPRP